MKVYVVCSEPYEMDIEGIFMTEKSAEEFMEKCKEKWKWAEYFIEEHEVIE